MRPKIVAEKNGLHIGVWLNEKTGCIHARARKRMGSALANEILDEVHEFEEWGDVLQHLRENDFVIHPVTAFRRIVH